MSRILNALLMGAIAATVAQAALRENPKQENQPMLKAVVHVNFADAERQGHGLKNIANIWDLVLSLRGLHYFSAK